MTETTASRRRDHTGRDMFISLAVLLVPILLIGALLRSCGSADPAVVDPSSAINDARQADLFPVVVPQGLDGWQPVQAAFRRTENATVGTLRLGYLAPGGSQALLVESNAEVGGLLAQELGDDVRSQGEVTINGQAWASSIVRGNERALVQTQTVRTIIVVGQASLDDLTALATALR